MSTNLYWDRLRKVTYRGCAIQPLKGIFAKKFFDNDGSMTEEDIILDKENIEWLEGLVDAGIQDADKMLKDLKELGTIRVWIGE